MKIKFKLIGSMMIAAATVVLGSCVSNEDSPGLEYMPDMYRSPSIEPYVDYGEVRERPDNDRKNTLSAKVPPFGTIPYVGTDSTDVSLMMPYFRKPMTAFKSTHGLYGFEYSDNDEYALAAADKNPYVLTAENYENILASGKTLYNNNCTHCHGEKGDGQGSMMKSGAFAGVPDYNNLKNLSDGQMFYSIYYGKGSMGAHGAQLNKKEIWTIIHHIRKMQDAGYGPGTETMTTEVADTIQEN